MPERFEDLAYILHKRAYKESSYIIDLFTREQGVVSVVAKGAKSNKSKFYLNLQLFNMLDVAYSGRTELMTLVQADINTPAYITGQKNIFCGYYVNELLLRLLHKHDQHPHLFDSYTKMVVALTENQKPEPMLRRFEKILLNEIGYGVDFSCTVDGEVLEEGVMYIVSPGEGIMAAAPGQRSELLVSGKSLIAFAADDFSDETTLAEIKKLMRRILQHYLGGKPLKSRDLFARTAGN